MREWERASIDEQVVCETISDATALIAKRNSAAAQAAFSNQSLPAASEAIVDVGASEAIVEYNRDPFHQGPRLHSKLTLDSSYNNIGCNSLLSMVVPRITPDLSETQPTTVVIIR